MIYLDHTKTAPAVAIRVITPNDSVDLPQVAGLRCRGLYASDSGDVSLIDATGHTVTVPVLAGGTLALEVSRVRATGTTVTAGNLFALY